MRWDTVIFEACKQANEDDVDLKKLTKALKLAGSDWLNENKILEKGMWSMPVLRELLKVPNIDVNAIDDYYNQTLLCAACTSGFEIETVKALLQAPGIDVNKPNNDTYGHTPLLECLYEDEFDNFRLLLQADGIDVNKGGNEGWTPLHVASDWEDITKLLLRFKEIQINKPSKSGETPLMSAVGFDGPTSVNLKVVHLLLQSKDINVNQSRDNGKTALYTACEGGSVDAVRLLLLHKDINVNQSRDNGKTALYTACEWGHVDTVHLLLRHKDINVNHSDNDGKTALYIACEKGSLNTVNALLNFDPHDDDKYDAASFQTNQSVDINKGPGELTPLDIAIKHEHWDIVVRLEDIPGTKKPSYKHNKGYINARNKATAHDAKLNMIADNIASKSKTPGAGDLATILGRQGHFLPKPVESSGTYMQFVKKE